MGSNYLIVDRSIVIRSEINKTIPTLHLLLGAMQDLVKHFHFSVKKVERMYLTENHYFNQLTNDEEATLSMWKFRSY